MNKKIYIDSFIVWESSEGNPLPDVSFVPSIIRRRLTDIQKITFYLVNHIIPTDCDMVFASRFGEWQETIKLIKQFYNDLEMSPSGFSNSVHNAAIGNLSIFIKNKHSYTAIAAGSNSLEMGILEAVISKKPVLFVYVEENQPEEYANLLDKPVTARGLAFLIKDEGPNCLTCSTHHSSHCLSFDEVKNFMSKGGKLESSHWIITTND